MAAQRLLDRVREVIRIKHYSIRTEQAYAQWIRRYILFHRKQHPGEQELIEATEHYEAQLRGLGNDLLLEVERLSAVLIELPSLGEKLDSMHRRLPLRRFPYPSSFGVMRVLSRRGCCPPQTQAALLVATSSRAMSAASTFFADADSA